MPKMTSGGNQDARRKRNIKCLAFIVAGVISQTVTTVLFLLLVMRIRNPKLRLGSVSVESFNLNSSSSSPSFSIKLSAQVTVKNTNFGHFKFDNSTATISYRGTEIGEGAISKERARFRSTKKLNVTVTASSGKASTNSHLRSDIDSGILQLSSRAKLSGKIHLFFIFKKKKSAEMNCTMELNTKIKAIQNLACK
ncbi:late embryogenesis abundant protein At1g64065-like [Alnus glutinosa]|uniref:late embryogenesis abundant protein At1g64065-like n=1 Tax=Alnus glutinosa TaxID=3517 RepID=UPI002D791243|nr:late embryogenesis abundant protein At1g64065-like [Alnus glutinosa]